MSFEHYFRHTAAINVTNSDNIMGSTQRKRKRKKKLTNSNESSNTIGWNVRLHIVNLVQWMMTYGKWQVSCNLQLTKFHPTGLRGFMAKENISSGSILVSIPQNILITRRFAESFVQNIFHDNNKYKCLSTQELLVIFLIVVKHFSDEVCKSTALFWKPYLDTLPATYDVPFYCTSNEVIRMIGITNNNGIILRWIRAKMNNNLPKKDFFVRQSGCGACEGDPNHPICFI